MPRLTDEELEALFHRPKEGVLPAVEDVTIGVYPMGLGFPGEVFDLKCPECPQMLRLRESREGRLFYGCLDYPLCKASHGAHTDGRPMGIPGDKTTNKARIFAHRIFDRLWKQEPGHAPKMTRNQAYTWLRKVLGLSDKDAHIGRFTTEQCNALIEAVKRKYPGVQNVWDRLGADDDPF